MSGFPKSVGDFKSKAAREHLEKALAWQEQVLGNLQKLAGVLMLPIGGFVTHTRFREAPYQVYQNDGKTPAPGTHASFTTAAFLFGSPVGDLAYATVCATEHKDGTGVLLFHADITTRDSDDKTNSYGGGSDLAYVDEGKWHRIEYSNSGPDVRLDASHWTRLVRMIQDTGYRLSVERVVRATLPGLA